MLYPYVLFSEPRDQVEARVLTHEMIHVRQVRRTGWLKFYAKYLNEYLAARFNGARHATAYAAISFEQEAYRNETLTSLSHNELKELGRA